MTGSVRLRDVTESDLPTLFEQQRDPIANELAAFPARDWDTFLAHWTRILGDATITKKTILFDEQVAGSVVSFEWLGEREIGYWIGRNYWGKGIATKALSEFLMHARTRPLRAWVAKHNVASRRVLEKCGFTFSREEQDSSPIAGDKLMGFVFELHANEGEPAG